jgi:two-component system response regulator MprA
VRILVVDDDPSLRDALERAIRLAGYQVAFAVDGLEALRALDSAEHHLVVLDLGLPLLDGVDVCRMMRERGDRTPVLMLTARDGVRDRVLGLDAGADDYLVKPFALDELLARIRALVRRTVAPPPDHRALEYRDVLLDPRTMQVRRGSRDVELTRTEFMLLELFMRNPRAVLTRTVIFERVWGFDFGSGSNSLDVYVSYLRKKLEAGGEPRVIHTVRGVGYALR